MVRGLLIAAAMTAAIGLSVSPAAAQMAGRMHGSHRSSPRFVSPIETTQGLGACGDFVRDGRHARHRDGRRRDGLICDGFAYADGQWALYNNRSWEPDSYNDWWNDRPDRAYPRWVQEQRMRGTCDPDRMWWSGSGWHC